MMRWLSLLLLLSPAVAAEGDVEAARELSRQGAEAFRAKDFAKALEKFEAANRLVPHPNLDVNLGRTYEALGRIDEAMIHCKIALNAPEVPESTRDAARKCVDRVSKALARPTLEVTSAPPGAAVKIDGKPVGTTPIRGAVAPGQHVVEFSKEGYRTVVRTVLAERGKQNSVSAVLSPEEVGGVLSVRSMPPGATVTLDGESLGPTPLQGFQVDAKTYTLEVAKPGYAQHVSTINVGDGKHLERDITLIPLDGPRVSSGGARPDWPAWAMMGAGAVAVGVGGYFGFSALADRQDADELARTSSDPADRPRYDSLVSSMETNRTTADVLYVAGGAIIVGGLTWLLWPD